MKTVVVTLQGERDRRKTAFIIHLSLSERIGRKIKNFNKRQYLMGLNPPLFCVKPLLCLMEGGPKMFYGSN